MAYKSGKIFLNFFQISWSQFKKGHYILSIHAIVTQMPLTLLTLAALKERQTQLCCKYIQKMTQNDHPINFLKPRTATSGHSYNLRASNNNRDILYQERVSLYADRSCCRTQRSGSFISFASKYVDSYLRYFYCFCGSNSVNYLLIVNLQPLNSVNSARWQINGIFIYLNKRLTSKNLMCNFLPVPEKNTFHSSNSDF